MTITPLDTAAHIVQLALTPVFLLSGVASLLNVFSSRLARVSDQVNRLVYEGDSLKFVGREARLRALRLRSRVLDVAVVLAALAGASTCGAALVLFLGAMRASDAAGVLFLLFGGAVILTMCALGAFVLEMLIASRGLRNLSEQNSPLS